MESLNCILCMELVCLRFFLSLRFGVLCRPAILAIGFNQLGLSADEGKRKEEREMEKQGERENQD